jgi:hypothetical protein
MKKIRCDYSSKASAIIKKKCRSHSFLLLLTMSLIVALSSSTTTCRRLLLISSQHYGVIGMMASATTVPSFPTRKRDAKYCDNNPHLFHQLRAGGGTRSNHKLFFLQSRSNTTDTNSSSTSDTTTKPPPPTQPTTNPQKKKKKSLLKRFRQGMGGVLSAAGFVSSTLVSLATDPKSIRDRTREPIRALRKFLQTSGVDLELSQTLLNRHLARNLALLGRVQYQLLSVQQQVGHHRSPLPA